MIRFPKLILTACLVGQMAFAPVYANTPGYGYNPTPEQLKILEGYNSEIKEARTQGPKLPPDVRVTPQTSNTPGASNAGPSVNVADNAGAVNVSAPGATRAEFEAGKPSRLRQIQQSSISMLDRLQDSNSRKADLAKATLDLPQNWLLIYGVIGAITCSVGAYNYNTTPEACLMHMARATDLKSNVQLAGMLLAYQAIGSQVGYNYGQSGTARAIRSVITDEQQMAAAATAYTSTSATEKARWSQFKRGTPDEGLLDQYLDGDEKRKAAIRADKNRYKGTASLKRQLVASTLIFPAAAVIAQFGTELVFDPDVQELVKGYYTSPDYKCMATIRVDQVGCSPIELETANSKLDEIRDATYKRIWDKHMSGTAMRNLAAQALMYGLIGLVATAGMSALRGAIINKAASEASGQIVLRSMVAKIPLMKVAGRVLVNFNIPLQIAMFFATNHYVIEPVMAYFQNIDTKKELLRSQEAYLNSLAKTLDLKPNSVRDLVFPDKMSNSNLWSIEKQTATLRADLKVIEAKFGGNASTDVEMPTSGPTIFQYITKAISLLTMGTGTTPQTVWDTATTVYPELSQSVTALSTAMAERRKVGSKDYYSALAQWQIHASEIVNGLDIMSKNYPPILRMIHSLKGDLAPNAARDTSLMRVISLSAADPEIASLLTTEERNSLANVAHNGLGELNGIHPKVLRLAAVLMLIFRTENNTELYQSLVGFLQKYPRFLTDVRPSWLGGTKNLRSRQATWELIEYLVSAADSENIQSTLQIGNLVRKGNYPEAAILEFLETSKTIISADTSEPFLPTDWMANSNWLAQLNPVDLYGSGYSVNHKGFGITTKTEALMIEMLCGLDIQDPSAQILAKGGILSRPQLRLPRVTEGSHKCADLRLPDFRPTPAITSGVAVDGKRESPFTALQKTLNSRLSPQALTTELNRGPVTVDVLFDQWYKSQVEPKIESELDTNIVAHLRQMFKSAWEDSSTDKFATPNTPSNRGSLPSKTGEYDSKAGTESAFYLASRLIPNGIRASFAEQLDVALRSFAIYVYKSGIISPDTPESEKFQSLILRQFQYQLMTASSVSRADEDIKEYLDTKSGLTEEARIKITTDCGLTTLTIEDEQKCIANVTAAAANQQDFGFILHQEPATKLAAIQTLLERDLLEVIKNAPNRLIGVNILSPLPLIRGENSIVNHNVNGKALVFAREAARQ